MKKTLQDQYLLIKEGKGHKGVFLADAKRQFPNIVRNAATFEEASSCLKTKNIIAENVIGLTAVNSPFEPKKKESYELAFENFLAEAKKKKEEDEKAELKATSKQVEKDLEHNFDYKDDKNPDNLIFDQIMTGYYTEMKDPKNVDKTMQELKDMVFKNLQKDPIFYTKDGQFGVKGLGYSVDHPGLGEPKEPKGKYKASGYGDLNESIQPINEEESKLRKVIREMVDAELNEASLGVINNDVAPSYPINVPISYGDDKNVAHYSDDYEYDRQEGLLDVEDYLKQIEGMSKGDAFNYLEEMGLGNDEILTILKNYKSLSLRESVEKELMAINKEAEHEIIASKLEKVQTLIDKKQAQITRLDEDEDLKDLTDAKKVKEISKDIKSLEKAKAKLEKMMHKGKAKLPRKEVIDETDETIDEVDTKPTEEYSVAREEARDEYNTSKGSIKKTQFKYPEFAEMLKSDIIGNEEGMDF
jgi:hypothetical protein